jgi:hypothetical protein
LTSLSAGSPHRLPAGDCRWQVRPHARVVGVYLLPRTSGRPVLPRSWMCFRDTSAFCIAHPFVSSQTPDTSSPWPCTGLSPARTTMGVPLSWDSRPVDNPVVTMMERIVRVGAMFGACALGSLPNLRRRERAATEVTSCLLPLPVNCNVFRRHRFRYAAVGVDLHQVKLWFVFHSPCVQDLRNGAIHTF